MGKVVKNLPMICKWCAKIQKSLSGCKFCTYPGSYNWIELIVQYIENIYVYSDDFLGKNMKRSIHGVGQMMSTMVLNRKQSALPGRPSVNLDGQSRQKDSIDLQDVTVMDTKLKILEILQVCARIFFWL